MPILTKFFPIGLKPPTSQFVRVCVVQGKHSTATRSQSRIVAEAAGGKDASRDNGLHIPTLDKLSSFGGYLGRKPGSRLTTWALDE